MSMSTSILARTSTALLAPLFFVASCGSGMTADQACTDSAKAQCAKVDQCRHNGTANIYGDLGTCISRLHDGCVAALAANATGNTPDLVETCALSLPAETCADFLSNNVVTACRTKVGSLAAGAGCIYSAQCQSSYCAVPKGAACGTCKSPPAVGDPCTDTGCNYNQVCTPMETCQPWVAQGGMCDNMSFVCAPGQTCVIAAMATKGTCQASATTVGATCDFKHQTGPGCDGTLGLFCNVTNKCTNLGYVDAGAVCGTPDKGMSFNVCTHAATCVASSVAGMASTCVALGREGAACDTATGPACLPTARCVVSGAATAGTCTAPDPTKCI